MFKNKKKLLVMLGIFLLTAILIGLSILLYKNYEKEQFAEEILNHYGKNVEVIKNSFLYDNNKQVVGILYKDLNIKLDSIKDKYNTYFKLENKDYYVLYSDVKEIDSSKEYNTYQHLLRYPVKNYIVKSNSKTKFYIDDKELFSVNKSLDLEVVMEDDSYYYVVLENNVYQVKKEEVIEEEKSEKQEYLEKISVFYFEDFDKVDEKLNYLKEKEYKSITPDDLKLFLNGNVELEKTSILLFYNKNLELDKIDKKDFNFYLEEDSDIEFTSGDSQVNRNSKKNTWYKVNKNTNINRFKDMLVGKKEVKVNSTTSTLPNNSVAVLNYHFFYSSKNMEICDESICLDTKNFEEQLKYLKDNNIDTLTMKEYVDWIYGRKELTRKSVLLTIDDGALGTDTHLPDLLEKYDANATLFLISGWWPMSKYRTGNLELQSHTHDLHYNNYKRDGKTGIKTTMLSYEELIADLSLSVQTVGTNLAFCYPFYAYNNTLVKAVKDTGFQVAFVGGNKKSTRNSDKYKIPRYIIYKNTSLSSFKNMVN